MVDEIIYPIIHVEITEGQIIFYAQKFGPHPGYPVPTLVDMSVFGHDGQEVLHVKHTVPAVPAIRPEDTMTIRLPVRVTTAEAVEGNGRIDLEEFGDG